MGAKNKQLIEQWVDLSDLPKFKNTGKKIDWSRSIGWKLPFKYGDISGEIKIVDVLSCEQGRRYLMVTIDKYVETPVKIRSDYLQQGLLYSLVCNKIIDTRPDVMQYLDDLEDAYRYSFGSGKYINVHCPICNYHKQSTPARLCCQGFGCPICGDGVKYPNKFISELLSQLHIDFVREATKKHPDLWWCKDFRYDFYIKINANHILIEADGGFHRYPDQKERDQQKDALAQQNGCIVVRIDCDYGGKDRCQYLKNHILSSDLGQYIPLDNINWDACNAKAMDSAVYDACTLWNNGKSVQEIKKILHVCSHTVCNYLKKGKEIGLCPSYSKNEARNRIIYPSVLCWNHQHYPRAFKDISELLTLSSLYYGKQFSRSCVLQTCKQKQSSHHGFQIKYITKEEYQQYKMIEDNGVILKGVE